MIEALLGVLWIGSLYVAYRRGKSVGADVAIQSVRSVRKLGLEGIDGFLKKLEKKGI